MIVLQREEGGKGEKDIYLQRSKHLSVAVAVVYYEDIAISESGVDLRRD